MDCGRFRALTSKNSYRYLVALLVVLTTEMDQRGHSHHRDWELGALTLTYGTLSPNDRLAKSLIILEYVYCRRQVPL
jgi:hypothetical protein